MIKEIKEYIENLAIVRYFTGMEEEIPLTKIQKELMKEPCDCGGKLYRVHGETESYLWCDGCDCSIDGSGGST